MKEEREKLRDEERREKKGQKENRPNMWGQLSPSRHVLSRACGCGFQHSLWGAREVEDRVDGCRPSPTPVHTFLSTSFPISVPSRGNGKKKRQPSM